MATYKELQAQLEKLHAQAEAVRAKEVGKVVEQIHNMMMDYAIQPGDLGFVQPVRKARKRSTAAPKYQNPQTGETWSGMGRAPAWIGKDREKYAIQAA